MPRAQEPGPAHFCPGMHHDAAPKRDGLTERGELGGDRTAGFE